ncbi:GAF domain-containing protein [Magnetococcales bacterium HHB-1]
MSNSSEKSTTLFKKANPRANLMIRPAQIPQKQTTSLKKSRPKKTAEKVSPKEKHAPTQQKTSLKKDQNKSTPPPSIKPEKNSAPIKTPPLPPRFLKKKTKRALPAQNTVSGNKNNIPKTPSPSTAVQSPQHKTEHAQKALQQKKTVTQTPKTVTVTPKEIPKEPLSHTPKPPVTSTKNRPPVPPKKRPEKEKQRHVRSSRQRWPVDLEKRLEDLNDKVRYLRFSRDLTREFACSCINYSGLTGVMEGIFNRVLEIMDAEAGSLWVQDARNEQNVCHQAEGPAKEQIIGLRLPIGKGIVGKVIEKNKEEVVFDCLKDQRFAAQIDKKSGFSTKSMICVPLNDGGEEAFGAIQIINKKNTESQRFTEYDTILVQDLAMSAAIAVRNARLLETETHIKEMDNLVKVSQRIVSTLNLDEVLTTLVNTADEIVEVTRTAVALLDEGHGEYRLAALSGGIEIDPDNADQQELLELMRIVGQSGKPFQIDNIEKYRLKNKDEDDPWANYIEKRNLKAAWAVPLQDDEGTLGVGWLESDLADFASGSKKDILYVLGSQATVALRNASLFQSVPFGEFLGKVGKKSQKLISGWRRVAMIVLTLLSMIAALHYLPIFRAVTGPCTIEARFGEGVFLPVAGKIKQVYVREGDEVKAGDLLVELDDAPIRLRLIESESRLGVLERQIVEAQAVGDTASYSRTLIERIAARAEVANAQEELKKVKILAHKSGIVLTPRTTELIGRDFPLGAEVLRTGNPEQFSAVIELPEEDVLDVKQGQKVRGILRSRPGKGFTGTIHHVGRAYSIPAEALDENVTDTAPKGFIAEITIKSSEVNLLPGMTGQAEISTPEVSALTRIWRRFTNFFVFWFGG